MYMFKDDHDLLKSKEVMKVFQIMRKGSWIKDCCIQISPRGVSFFTLVAWPLRDLGLY